MKATCDSLLVVALTITQIGLAHSSYVLAGAQSPNPTSIRKYQLLQKKINFISAKGSQRTPNPPGWKEYDGSLYTKERGYGWLNDVSDGGWDGGGQGDMILPDGTRASPEALGRLELANWQGTHQENRPIVFRIDLPNGWYRVTCTSVDPDNIPLPLVDQRSVKFRAHDVVFAGPNHGAPLKIEGNRLVEGSDIVEVMDGHLRIVVGDPAYGGWTWAYTGPFWHRWRWWYRHSFYASTWYQKLTRTVDPGFHSLRFNSLQIERVAAPVKKVALVFRDFFNRDDSPDVNSGVAEGNRWLRVKLHPGTADHITPELYKTSLKLTGQKRGKDVVGVVQEKTSPKKGTIRYSTKVSLFTGEGSKIHSGSQEAGLIILSRPTAPTEFNSTFIGIAFDRSRSETAGWVRYRVGDGRSGYRTNVEIQDTSLPFRITEGEYEIIVDHDLRNHILKGVRINDYDITGSFSLADRKQRVSTGRFGIRALMDSLDSGVSLQQFYWYYRVEDILRNNIWSSN